MIRERYRLFIFMTVATDPCISSHLPCFVCILCSPEDQCMHAHWSHLQYSAGILGVFSALKNSEYMHANSIIFLN